MKKATITEKELRAAWTAQNVPKARQDAMIAQTIAKAQPGADKPHDYGPTIGRGRNAVPTNPHPQSPMGRALAAKLATDMTPAGKQTVLPGAERATDATMAQRRTNAPLRPKANQRPCDVGLFSDEKNQTSLF